MFMNEKDLERTGESILYSSDYHGFHKFFEAVWNSPNQYVVLFARRCYALNNIFMRTYLSEDDRKRKCKRIVTQNGFLPYASVFAASYDKDRTLPSVLLVDDIMLHGRGVAKLLFDFEMLILEEWKKIRGKDATDSEKYYLHFDLLDAVKVSVYAINETPMLLEGSSSWKIEPVIKGTSKELRALSQRISSFLLKAGEPNTSYRYSFLIPTSRIMEDQIAGWDSILWNYRGENRKVYIKRCDFCEKISPIVHTYGKIMDNDKEYVWITGETIFGDITSEEFNRIAANVGAILGTNETWQFLVQILGKQSERLYRTRMQLMSFLLSVMWVNDFCSACGLDIDDLYHKEMSKEIQKRINFDMHKLAGNFGLAEDAHKGMWLFLDNRNFTVALRNQVQDAFTLSPETMYSPISVSGDKTVPCEQYNTIVEKLFYQLGTDSEFEAYEMSCNKRRFIPDVPGSDVISLSKCIANIDAALKAQGAEPDIRFIQACLSTLVDCGLAAMNFSYNRETKRIECTFKAGELSTFVMPRKFHWFMPAFAKIESEYFRTDETPPELIKEFISQIEMGDDTAPECHPSTQIEKEAFVLLKKFGSEFVDRIYRCGQSMNGWNTNLVTLDDSKALYTGFQISYRDILIHRNKRQEYYISKAKSFIKEKASY